MSKVVSISRKKTKKINFEEINEVLNKIKFEKKHEESDKKTIWRYSDKKFLDGKIETIKYREVTLLCDEATEEKKMEIITNTKIEMGLIDPNITDLIFLNYKPSGIQKIKNYINPKKKIGILSHFQIGPHGEKRYPVIDKENHISYFPFFEFGNGRIKFLLIEPPKTIKSEKFEEKTFYRKETHQTPKVPIFFF